MLIDRNNWRNHRVWAGFAALATLGATLWYAASSLLARRLLGGGSLPGFTFGVIGGLICAFEFLLWPRKAYRALRVGRVQAWMKAHIWLGLLSLPILVLHSGFRLGGALSAAVMVLFLVVIASGVWGLAMQNVIPRKMLSDLPAETIYSQIDRIIGQFHDEASRLVDATCGKAEGAVADAEEAEDPGDAGTQFLVVGAVRSAGRIRGKVLQTRAVGVPVAGSEALRPFFDRVAGPFLRPDGLAGSPLRHKERAAALFLDLKTRLAPAAHPTADALLDLCDQRRQLAEQARLHAWLHNWLLIHLPLSVALMVLMAVHIVVALKYL